MIDLNKVKLFVKEYYQKNKKIPLMKTVAIRFGMDDAQVLGVYRTLVDDGFLKRNYSQYKKTEELEKKIILPPEEKTIKKTNIVFMWLRFFLRLFKKKKKTINISKGTILFLRISCLIIGGGALVFSIYYTSKLLITTNPVWLSWGLSTIMIWFSVICFGLIVLFYKKGVWPLIPLFTVLWVLVISYSMYSTVAGQYNERIVNEIEEVEKNSENIGKKNKYDLYNKQENDLENRIFGKEKDLETYRIIMDDFDTLEKRKENSQVYYDTDWRIRQAENQINSWRVELKEIQDKKENFLEFETVNSGTLEETTIKKESFYIWINKLFGVDPEQVKFWSSVFPAIFIDIIASLAFAVTMFLKGDKKNE